jgi:hypothetical protein
MAILTILGFIAFATLSVFGFISIMKQIQEVDNVYQKRIAKLEEENENIQRERLQYLAGIKTKTEVPQVPAKLGPEIVGELLAESEVDLLKEIEEDQEKLKKVFHPAVGKQYTRR